MQPKKFEKEHKVLIDIRRKKEAIEEHWNEHTTKTDTWQKKTTIIKEPKNILIFFFFLFWERTLPTGAQEFQGFH